MSVLEQARKAYARLKLQGNGHGEAPALPSPAYERNELNEQSPPYLLVRDAASLVMVRTAVDDTSMIGLDVETTGLNPRIDRLRLLSLAADTIDGRTFTYMIDCFVVDPSSLWELLAEKELVIHNAAFDLAFLHRLGFTAEIVHDTRLLAQLLVAGKPEMYRCGLEEVVQLELGRELDKTHQRSDWSGQLTETQLSYAANDAAVLVPLFAALSAKVKAAGMGRVATIERRCLPAVVWTATSGIGFNLQRWEALAATAQADADRLRGELDAAAPPKPGCFAFDPWEWDSPVKVRDAFAAAGIALKDTADETLAGVNHPFAEQLRQYRDATKRSSTYGQDWLRHVAEDGRIYADWRQIGAKTGRMASADPNLQNLPRGPAYRQCFRAGPGRVLVKADYSQIEVRIVAKVANETQMIEAYRRGDDLHTLTARRITGKTEVTKEERQLAKPVNFGLIYGLGAKALRRKAKAEYGLKLSVREAGRYRRGFFAAYPAIGAWHNTIRRQKAEETRTLAGRRVLVDSAGFYGAKANYIVQGTGADAVKAALALLWERRSEVPGAFPVLIVHDEIVIEADAGQADVAAAWLQKAMVDAIAPLIDPVPVVVETKIGQSWGGD
jgi:DNA polymerase-1